ncbi:hypothetical protein [Pseudomonas sp. DSP3-2-2]|uniref:hypothetical protein n=1 Tax=unclassified Pseudomonas TaxID=196821 RepID=UPI003CF13327
MTNGGSQSDRCEPLVVVSLAWVFLGIGKILPQAEYMLGIGLNPTSTCKTITRFKNSQMLFSMPGGITLSQTFVMDKYVIAAKLPALPRHSVFGSPETHLINRLGRHLCVVPCRLLTLSLQEMTAFKVIG